MSQKKSQKHAGSTQKFIEVQDIVEDIVLLQNGSACLIIEVQATNFSLLSQEEQGVKISSYAALLNSLSFPVQILVRNKKVDISSYLKLLEQEVGKARNEKVAMQIGLYRDFIAEIVKVNTVLDKKFYLVIPYSPLEKGAGQAIKGGSDPKEIKQALHAKSDTLLSQFARLSLNARILDKESLVKLFYEIYNQDLEQASGVEQTFAPSVVMAQPAQK